MSENIITESQIDKVIEWMKENCTSNPYIAENIGGVELIKELMYEEVTDMIHYLENEYK